MVLVEPSLTSDVFRGGQVNINFPHIEESFYLLVTLSCHVVLENKQALLICRISLTLIFIYNYLSKCLFMTMCNRLLFDF